MAILALPTAVLAQNNQVRNQNEVQTQNQGEESQLEVNTQEQEALQAKKPNPRSQTARENMSIVAQRVEEILAGRDFQGGIGDQVREIAREQKQAQLETEDELNKIEARSGFMKRLFGPDYGAIKNLKRQMEQNQLRIRILEQLVNQVQNQAEEEQLQEAIQALVQQNTALEEQLQAEERVGSIFGWLIRFFNR